MVLTAFLLMSAIHSLGIETGFKGAQKFPEDYTYNFYKSELCSAAFDEIYDLPCSYIGYELLECWSLLLIPIMLYHRKKLK